MALLRFPALIGSVQRSTVGGMSASAGKPLRQTGFRDGGAILREARCGRLLAQRALNCSAAALFLCATGAWGQGPRPSKPDARTKDDRPEIVVTGTRGSAVTDVAPIAVLGREAIDATGASTMAELLQAIRGSTQSADGADPIF